MSKDQLADMQRKNIDAAMELAQMSLENSRRIMELQVDTARTLFEDSVRNARALAAAKDPQAALALRTQFAQETSTHMMEAMRRMAEMTAASQAEFNKVLGKQMAGTSQEMMENFKKVMSVSGLPGSGEDAFATMQKAFGTARDAFDQIAKASAAAFNMGGGKGKGKSVKVE